MSREDSSEGTTTVWQWKSVVGRGNGWRQKSEYGRMWQMTRQLTRGSRER